MYISSSLLGQLSSLDLQCLPQGTHLREKNSDEIACLLHVYCILNCILVQHCKLSFQLANIDRSIMTDASFISAHVEPLVPAGMTSLHCREGR